MRKNIAHAARPVRHILFTEWRFEHQGLVQALLCGGNMRRAIALAGLADDYFRLR